MKAGHFPRWKQLAAIVGIVAFLPSPLLMLPAVQALPAGVVSGNPTPEDRARLRKDYEKYVENEKAASQERLGKILAANEASWRSIEKTAPFWKQGDGFESKIVINNGRPRTVEVTPVIRLADGRILPTQTIRIEAAASLDVPLSSLIGEKEGYGQIAVRYEGEPLEITALIVVTNLERSLSFDHLFEMKDEFSESTIDGVFYLPSSSTQPEVVLANTSDKVVSVSVTLKAENQSSSPLSQYVAVKPRETEIVNLRPMLRSSNGLVPLAAHVNIQHTGAPADLRMHGLLMDANGYSANMRFLESSAVVGKRLLSPVPPLDTPHGAVVVLANLNENSATVHLEAYYSLNGNVGEATLRTVTVPAKGTIHVDITREVRGLPVGSTDIALVFDYYARGGLLADLLLIDESGSGVYQVSPKGYSSHSHNSHNFPFRLDGNQNTILTLANPSDTEDLNYAINFHYDGKAYGFKGKPLRPGEVRNINLKNLRDQQVPGHKGELMPLETTAGQVTLDFFRNRKPGSMPSTDHSGHSEIPALGIASATVYDKERKIAYVSCAPGCQAEYWTMEITNQYYEGFVGDTFGTQVTVYNIIWGYFVLDGYAVDWTQNGYPVTEAQGFEINLLAEGTTYLTANVWIYDQWCNTYCTCVAIFGAAIPITLFVVAQSPVIVKEDDTSCPLTVDRGETLGVKLVTLPSNPTIEWSFTGANGGSAAKSGGTTWSGFWASSGTITATVNGTPVSCMVTVTPRNWAFQPSAPQEETTGLVGGVPWHAAWKRDSISPYMQPVTTLGYNGVINIPVTTSWAEANVRVIPDGPNTGYLYFLNPPTVGRAFLWAVHPDLLNANAAFNQHQYGTYSLNNPNGVTSAAALIDAIKKHEYEDATRSHYKLYVDALAQHNAGTNFERHVGLPNTSVDTFRFGGQSVISTTLTALESTYNSSGVGNGPEPYNPWIDPAAAEYIGRINLQLSDGSFQY